MSCSRDVVTHAHGYNLVMARSPVVRHIQLKAGTARRPSKVSLARVLAEKPSGCAIWMRLDQDLNMGPYFWFGGAPGQPLPAIGGYPNALRATRNKEGVRPVRANHHEVPGSAFARRDSLVEVLEDLFGGSRDEGGRWAVLKESWRSPARRGAYHRRRPDLFCRRERNGTEIDPESRALLV